MRFLVHVVLARTVRAVVAHRLPGLRHYAVGVSTSQDLPSARPAPEVLLRDVVDTLHTWYPPGTADSWDAVGLVAGDPERPVAKVMFAVDPTLEVARDAVAWGADLLVVHHPLFLKPVHSIAPTTAKGRTLNTLLAGGCGLLTAHTNADQALTGVSESLALALGLSDLAPIIAAPAPARDRLVVFVPVADVERVRDALHEAGAGAGGNYDSTSFEVPGRGQFRALPGADPHLGQVGRVEVVEEIRLEIDFPRTLRSRVVRAMLAAHPYEDVAYDVVELADARPTDTGTGRVGTVEPTTLAEFAARVASVLPATAQGVRVAGDPQRPVSRVALCGGAGDFLLDRLASSDADVYLTSDLRHHPASEFMEKQGPALIDVPHWAAEWMWLPQVAARVSEHWGGTVAVRVNERRTDPWTFRVASDTFEGDLR